MDISKILEFHQKVMVSSRSKQELDETSCGPLCQHPACWDSNQRRERGIPHTCMTQAKKDTKEIDFPTVKFYNFLNEYGEGQVPSSAHITGPQQTSPRAYQPAALHSTSLIMVAPHSSPALSNVDRNLETASQVHLVEVQEVFDEEELSSTWDETFVTKKCMVWVPNSTRSSVEKRNKSETARSWNGKSGPSILPPKDLTEAMVPMEVKQKRENTILKKQSLSKIPLLKRALYPQTPYTGASKPDFDSDGIRELLALPPDALVQVLDHIKRSDIVSKERIHGIIQEVLATAHAGPKGTKESMTFTSGLGTSDVFLQQKVPLYPSRQRNIRGTYAMQQKPVFQMDCGDGESSEYSARNESRTNVCSPSDFFPTVIPHYKVVPGIVGKEQSAQEAKSQADLSHLLRKKIPSVSLGLPELPRGLQQTRAFVYKTKHQLDFTLVPVPTPPQSVRSTETIGSGHGTTIQVNLPSASDFKDADPNQEVMVSAAHENDQSEKIQVISTSQSLYLPTAGSQLTDSSHSEQPVLQLSSKKHQSPSHEGQALRTSHGPLASKVAAGLSMISETAQEIDQSLTTMKDKNSPFIEPLSHAPSSLKDEETALPMPEYGASVIAADYWPQVKESTYDTDNNAVRSRSAAGAVGGVESGIPTEQGVPAHRAHSGPSMRRSESTIRAKMIMAESSSLAAAPPPPPPSPEPKEFPERTSNQSFKDNKSGDSSFAGLVLEQNESQASENPRELSQWKNLNLSSGIEDKSLSHNYSAAGDVEQGSNPTRIPSSDTVTSSRTSSAILPSPEIGSPVHLSSSIDPKKTGATKKKRDKKKMKSKKTEDSSSRKDSAKMKLSEEEGSEPSAFLSSDLDPALKN
ncbi:uncharacterized protein LOC112575882 isoform X4 [Pomacea canaliculata]|nr:uncharacterized protein LOC112575882 isoform X4 [Pomacea canaliculata]